MHPLNRYTPLPKWAKKAKAIQDKPFPILGRVRQYNLLCILVKRDYSWQMALKDAVRVPFKKEVENVLFCGDGCALPSMVGNRNAQC
mmetsp:Transcript_35384/g.75439  ORF Transcript_35384/g.75439 Transcript_35384/m.75439 type:complete len:87 (+) Transcript_35384:710-970(+)